MSNSLIFEYELLAGDPLEVVAPDETPVLSDSGATFGIRRTDTGAVVVAAGTALTPVGGNKFNYVLNNPVDGVAYEASIKAKYLGSTIYESKTKTFNSGIPTGDYHSYQDIIDLLGADNVRTVSNLDGEDAQVDYDRILRAIRYAEATVNGKLKPIFAIPLSPSESYDQVLLADTCARLSAWWLSQNRGLKDDSDEVAGQMANHREIALNQLSMWMLQPTNFSTSLRTAKNTGPVSCVPANEIPLPPAVPPLYPRPE